MYPAPPNQDIEHLHWLAISHYIYAAFVACFSLFGLVFFGFGVALISRPQAFDGPNPPPPFLGPLFATIGAGIALAILGFAVLTFLAGRFLARRKHHLFCLIMAGINCLWMPLGTLLGVFTIMVLVRPTVKVMFRV